MMRSLLVPVAVLFSILAASCRSTMPPEGLSNEDRVALRLFAEKDASIVLARNWDALAAQYTDDAVRMPPNEPSVQGRAAIRRWLDQFPPINSFTFELADLEGNGDIAFLRGKFTITFTPPGAMATLSDSGKILVVFRKQPDGSWLRVVDAWNSDLPPGK